MKGDTLKNALVRMKILKRDLDRQPADESWLFNSTGIGRKTMRAMLELKVVYENGGKYHFASVKPSMELMILVYGRRQSTEVEERKPKRIRETPAVKEVTPIPAVKRKHGKELISSVSENGIINSDVSGILLMGFKL